VLVRAGSRSVSFAVTALTGPASARIDITLPASLGGGALAVSASSYEALTLDITPSPLSIVAGATATITMKVSPANGEPLLIGLQSLDSAIAAAPASVTIPAGGVGNFAVQGLQRGSTVIRAITPQQAGSETTLIVVDVIDAPTTPVIFSVSPATGPVSGGTPVSITGALLGNDCLLQFGGVAAAPTFVNQTQLTAITPARAAGTVDVHLTCGSNSFTLANGFTYIAAGPTIADVSPASGNIDGTTVVKISGANLSGACGVFFDGIAAHVVVAEGSTALHAIAPPHAAASVDVAV
jgi:hypothetical protein